MFYDGIEDDYYGVRLVFEYPPISDCPLSEFVYSGHDLLTMLLQSQQRLYELTQSRLNFDEPVPYPVTASVPIEWLDLASLLRQGRHNPQHPLLSMDIGGRKVVAYVPSDRYVHDKGELPLYAVRTNVPSPSSPDEKTTLLVVENADHMPLITEAEVACINPILNDRGSARLSYIDCYVALQNHYGEHFDDPVIVRECRQVLSGKRLSPGHADVIPVLMTAWFCSEVSRNRACLVTGVMLLDLIEAQVPCPSASSEGASRYTFRNSLWHPDAYAMTPKERGANKHLAKHGGFHPMAHWGSWSEEFADDGSYQSNHVLTRAHVKSIVILIDWISRLSSHRALEGVKVVRLSKTEYQQASAEQQRQYERCIRQRQRNRQLWQYNALAIQLIYGVIIERLKSFTSMMLVDTGVAVRSEAKTRIIRNRTDRLTSLGAQADTMMAESIATNQRLKREREEVYTTQFRKYLVEIELLVKCRESALKMIKRFVPDYTASQFDYCLPGANISYAVFVSWFVELLIYNNRSINILLNARSDEVKLCLYRLIFSTPQIYAPMAQMYNSMFGFILTLSVQTPIRAILIDALFEAQNVSFLMMLSPKDLLEICDKSNRCFKLLFIQRPELFREIISAEPAWKINEILYRILCHGDGFTESELATIRTHEYNDSIIFALEPRCSALPPI